MAFKKFIASAAAFFVLGFSPMSGVSSNMNNEGLSSRPTQTKTLDQKINDEWVKVDSIEDNVEIISCGIPPDKWVGETIIDGSTSKPTSQLTSQKYAVISTGASIRNRVEGLYDPIDKNAFWVSTVRVYNALLKNGYKPKNVFVLYKDGKPPFNDKSLPIDKIKKEFDGSYNNIATYLNLRKIMNSLESKIRPQDTFTLYLNQHGSSDGYAHFEQDGSYFSGHDLTRILNGNKSKDILVFVGTCHAEAFGDDVGYPATIISGSRENMLGWADKNYSVGAVFFQALNNKENDLDKDGKVSYYEAFRKAKEVSKKYRKDIDYFLRHQYNDPKWYSGDLDKMDLIPVYIER